MAVEAGSRPGGETVRVRRTGLSGIVAVEARSTRAYGRHTHDDFGIGIVLSGAQVSASGRGPVRAEPGQVITVNPGEVHDGLPVGGAPRHWRMLYLRPEILADAFEGLGVPAGAELVHPVLDRPVAARAFIALHAALSVAPQPATAVEGLLIETVSHLVDETATDRRAPPGAVEAARRRIDDDPAAETRLDALASLCGLSRFHFLRTFRAATGLPPHAYQVQRRLQLARRLILGGTGLAEAAVAAGFTDQSHFHRHFLRAYGHTPGRLAKA